MAQVEWQPFGDHPSRGARRRARACAVFVVCAHAHAHPGRSCDSFNQLAKKLVSRLAASLAKPLKD